MNEIDRAIFPRDRSDLLDRLAKRLARHRTANLFKGNGWTCGMVVTDTRAGFRIDQPLSESRSDVTRGQCRDMRRPGKILEIAVGSRLHEAVHN